MSQNKEGMIKANLLIVDDHKNVIKALVHLLEQEFSGIHTSTNPNLIPGLIREHKIDLVLLDMNFAAGISSGNEGIYWLEQILQTDPDIAVVLITAYGDVELAVRAVKKGAIDFILKPWDNEKLITTLKSAYKLRQSKLQILSLRNKQAHLTRNLERSYDPLIGSSSAMREVFATIEKVAGTNTNVLITGENGTGKELVAHELHRQSDRTDEIFVPVDMGSLSESLFESEVFGHVKGAFTDAREDRPGRFEIASGGTLFLDEIGNLSLPLQAKLLSVLQNQQVIRLGSNTPTSIDIRLVSATNRDLKELINRNLFREDLYYRINTIEIHIPPLRERGDDILRLTNFFIQKYCQKYQKALVKIPERSIGKLMKHSWPGNVRELQHTIEKAVILSDSDVLNPDVLILSGNEPAKAGTRVPLTLEEIEKQALQNVLEYHRGSISKTAEELGLTRQTIYNKLVKFGLDKSPTLKTRKK